ncbi:MAG TPA: phosphoribosylanthranilate isomerase [Solirubrobacteraceae bacterium]|jgi:phosphoribosylanthranilate isomerase|nr:phosphoribosylanthranilate isomerase [Solirubrobacteraceae bacterium]
MTTRPLVKICGITNLDDAEFAFELGAWALGMIFYEGSPRRCSNAEAQVIAAALRRRVQLCGVFVNAPLELIARQSEDLGLSLVQLHGDEGPAFCSEVARRTGAHVIKAVQVSVPADVRDLERFHVDFHLLDARSKALERQGMRGGTGETFDWGLVATRRSKVPLILSGGLSAENVAEAIAVVQPYAVDSASGTESTPGHKDHDKLRAFFDAVAEACPEPVEDPVPVGEDPGSVGEDPVSIGGAPA